MGHAHQAQAGESAYQWYRLEQIAQAAGEAVVKQIFHAGEGVTLILIDGVEYEMTLKRRDDEPDS